MPRRRWDQRVRDMIDAAERILTLVQGLSFEEFVYDRDVRDSIFYKIVVLGEAAGAVPPEIQATAPEIPWAELKDLRNWITHVYHAVGNRRVWQVITTELTENRPAPEGRARPRPRR